MRAVWYSARVLGAVMSKRLFLLGESRGNHVPIPTGLRCPQCNSSNLQKVSLAHEKGLYHLNVRTRVTGAMVGSGGPGLFLGGARTRGSHQSELSRRLRPPMKWLYRKVFGWFVAVSFVSLLAYVHMVMASVRPVASLPGEVFAIALLAFLIAALAAVWRHNHSAYPRAFAQWDHSFVCLKCGAIAE
jgi:hypothetical protein